VAWLCVVGRTTDGVTFRGFSEEAACDPQGFCWELETLALKVKLSAVTDMIEEDVEGA